MKIKEQEKSENSNSWCVRQRFEKYSKILHRPGKEWIKKTKALNDIIHKDVYNDMGRQPGEAK